MSPSQPRTPGRPPPLALTIAGSDCSGGAGIEADLKTFAAHGVYGMSVVTCVVAETPGKVVSIHPVPSKIVEEQMACCLWGLGGVVVKTGMLHSADTIRVVRRQLSAFGSRFSALVVDPVMVATSGARLLKRAAIRELERLIEEHADLLTPNLDEAEILAHRRIRDEEEMEAAAKEMADRFSCAVVLKGGHLRSSRRAADFLWDGEDGTWFRATRISGVKTHGTGCTYSAAIAANIAKGQTLTTSVKNAKQFVTRAIRRTVRLGPWMALGHAPLGAKKAGMRA